MTPTPRQAKDLLIEPAPAAWRDAILAITLDVRIPLTRGQLGLEGLRGVMSGHQPTFWHPGILAKYFAVVHSGQFRSGDRTATAEWVVVDQDAVPPFRVRLPVVRAGRLAVATVDLAPARDEVPACLQPVARAAMPVFDAALGEPALPCVREGLERIVAALNNRAGEENAARQAALAAADLLASIVPAPRIFFATTLARTDLFRELAAKMAADPRACWSAYNQAAAAHTLAGIRPLIRHADQYELPLWRLIGGRRVRVMSGESLAADLAPKALFMTMLLRLAACNLFVHGLGGGSAGGGYDSVMEEWARAWLGEGGLLNAPSATVTATRTLPFPARDDADPRRALWDAHHARHDPSLLSDSAAAAQKQRLVALIRDTPRGTERTRLYSQLQSTLEEYRARHPRELDDLRIRGEAARAAVPAEEIRRDRAWPFPFYPESTLRELSEIIRDALTERNP